MNKPSGKHILVEVSVPETRLALMEGDSLLEIVYVDHFGLGAVDRGGSIVLGRVTGVNSALGAAFVDIGLPTPGFCRLHKNDPVIGEGGLHLFQISANPIEDKGFRLTTDVSLPGRTVVLHPARKGVTVSSKITDPRTRQRLSSLSPQEGGVTVRTAAGGVEVETVRAELAALEQKWRDLESHPERAPIILHDANQASFRLSQMIAANPGASVTCEGPIAALGVGDGWPAVATYRGSDVSLFESLGVEEQIEEALQSVVDLPSGAWMSIEATRALTAVDVNSGALWAPSSKDTALETNQHAAQKLAQQLRLRGIGGIVVIDFVQMQSRKDRERIVSDFRSYLALDPTPHRVGRISPFGLLEMTRKRNGLSLADRLISRSCSSEMPLSTEAAAYALCRRLGVAAKVNRTGELDVRLSDDLSEWLEGVGAPLFKASLDEIPHRVTLTTESSRSLEAFEIL